MTQFTQADAEHIKSLLRQVPVPISSLGYYPNLLTPDEAERATDVEHIRKVIAASAMIGVNVMTTFVGRDPARSIEDPWGDVADTRNPLIVFAEQQGVKVGIENCPMLFSLDE